MSNILVFLFFVTALCVSNSNGYTVSKGLTHMNIVAGKEAKLGEFPWMVALQTINKTSKTTKYLCGGTIYSKNFIITAAHCVSSKSNISIYVRAGSLQNNKGGSLRRVLDVIEHPNKKVDLAMLEIWPPLKFHSHIHPVRLQNNADFNSCNMLDVAGWGYLNETTPGPINLQRVQVPYVTNKLCKEWMKMTISENEMCAGYKSGVKDSCWGDSGGPLTCKGRLYGIVSWGIGCARSNRPGVYVRVSKFNDWIRETAKETSAHYYMKPFKTVGE